LLTADAAASLTQELAATLLDDAAANDTEIGSSGRSVWAAVAVVAAVAVISLSMYRSSARTTRCSSANRRRCCARPTRIRPHSAIW
jgi:hypothetical protein